MIRPPPARYLGTKILPRIVTLCMCSLPSPFSRFRFLLRSVYSQFHHCLCGGAEEWGHRHPKIVQRAWKAFSEERFKKSKTRCATTRNTDDRRPRRLGKSRRAVALGCTGSCVRARDYPLYLQHCWYREKIGADLYNIDDDDRDSCVRFWRLYRGDGSFNR